MIPSEVAPGHRAPLKIINRVWTMKHGESDVAHWYSACGDTLFLAVMRVTMDYQVCAGPVDRFGQQVASQEWIYFQPLSCDGVFDGGIMQQGHAEMCIQAVKRCLEAACELFGMMDECFHFGLAKGAAAGAGKATSEPRCPGDSNRFIPYSNALAFGLEDSYARV